MQGHEFAQQYLANERQLDFDDEALRAHLARLASPRLVRRQRLLTQPRRAAHPYRRNRRRANLPQSMRGRRARDHQSPSRDTAPTLVMRTALPHCTRTAPPPSRTHV
jgi:hypothetical protein